MYLTVESGYKGLQGKRPTMEDAHVVFNNFSDIPDCKFEKKKEEFGLFTMDMEVIKLQK